MASNYPTGLDAFTTGTLTGIVSGSDHGNKGDALNKIEAELGTSPSGQAATVKARLDNSLPYNVKDYGALGDGTTNDYTAINAAITAAGSAGGGIVYFPPGNYVFGTKLTLPVMTAGALMLRGAGVATTKLTFTGAVASSSAINMGGGTPGTETRWTYCEDFTLIGNSTVEGGVLIDAAIFCGLRRLRIEGFTHAAAASVRIRADSAQQFSNYYHRIDSCDIRDSPVGILMEGEDTAGTGANSNVITNCQFGSHSGSAVKIIRADSNRIEFCEFNGSTVVGVRIEGNSIYNLLFANQFDMPGATNGAVLADSAVSKTKLLHNTGGEWTVSDAGTGTYREDVMAASLPTIASASSIAIRGAGNHDAYLVSGSTTITSITAQWAGRQIILIWAAGATFDVTDGSNLKLASSITAHDADDTLSLVCDGTNWIETGRTVT